MVFTASTQAYADAVLNVLDPHQALIHHRHLLPEKNESFEKALMIIPLYKAILDRVLPKP